MSNGDCRTQDNIMYTLGIIADQVEKQAKMKCTFLVGGPEPKQDGKFSIMVYAFILFSYRIAHV